MPGLRHHGGLYAPRLYSRGDTIGLYGTGIVVSSYDGGLCRTSGLDPAVHDVDGVERSLVTIYESDTVTIHASASSLSPCSPELARDAADVERDGLLAFAKARRNACVVYDHAGPIRVVPHAPSGAQIPVLLAGVIARTRLVALGSIDVGESVAVMLESASQPMEKVVRAVGRSTDGEVCEVLCLLAQEVYDIASVCGFYGALSSSTYAMALMVHGCVLHVRPGCDTRVGLARLMEAVHSCPHADFSFVTRGLSAVSDGCAVSLEYRPASKSCRVAGSACWGSSFSARLVDPRKLSVSYVPAPPTIESCLECFNQQRFLLAKVVGGEPAAAPPFRKQTGCATCGASARWWCPCGHALYCSTECQRADWRRHRRGCAGLRSEVARRARAEASLADALQQIASMA
ncbi:MAG: zinc finger MYND domain-containing protein [Halieaceae bacterium]